MDVSSGRSARAGKIAFALVTLVGGALLAAWPAHAQIGENLVPPLPVDLPTVTLTTTPTPLPTLPSTDPELDGGLVDDTVDQLLGGGTDGPEPGEEPEGGTDPSPSPGPGQNTNGGSGTETGSQGSGVAPDGTTDDGDGTSNGSSGSGEGEATPSAGGFDLTEQAYPAVAARATVAAAGRAIRLAGPFAPPLILAVVSFVGLVAIGRGTDRMFKLEALRPGTRTFRL